MSIEQVELSKLAHEARTMLDLYPTTLDARLAFERFAKAALRSPATAGGVRAYQALFEPEESDAFDNLEGALIDIERLSADGKPTDDVCIRTIKRVLDQLGAAYTALSASLVQGVQTEASTRNVGSPGAERSETETAVRALRMARERIRYLGHLGESHFKANEKTFIPAIDEAIAQLSKTLTAPDNASNLSGVSAEPTPGALR